MIAFSVFVHSSLECVVKCQQFVGKALSDLLRHGLELSLRFTTSGGLQLPVTFRAASHR